MACAALTYCSPHTTPSCASPSGSACSRSCHRSSSSSRTGVPSAADRYCEPSVERRGSARCERREQHLSHAQLCFYGSVVDSLVALRRDLVGDDGRRQPDGFSRCRISRSSAWEPRTPWTSAARWYASCRARGDAAKEQLEQTAHELRSRSRPAGLHRRSASSRHMGHGIAGLAVLARRICKVVCKVAIRDKRKPELLFGF